jgi:hypothetical protein
MMNIARSVFIALAAAMCIPAPADAADTVLSGTITSAAGEKLGGVTVSTKPVGGTRPAGTPSSSS